MTMTSALHLTASDIEAPGMWSISSLPLIPSPPRPGASVPVKSRFMAQITPFKSHSYSTVKKQQKKQHKNVNMKYNSRYKNNPIGLLPLKSINH